MIFAIKRVVIKVHGRVQGVFFRTHTKEKADQLGLTGCVKNESDGSVLVVAEGEREQLEQFLGWIKEGGPLFAKIDRVDVKWEGQDGKFTNFDILY